MPGDTAENQHRAAERHADGHVLLLPRDVISDRPIQQFAEQATDSSGAGRGETAPTRLGVTGAAAAHVQVGPKSALSTILLQYVMSYNTQAVLFDGFYTRKKIKK